MKHYLNICLAVVCIAIAAPRALAWGQKGHDVTCYIAEQHLTPEAAAAVTDLLDGKSLVYWANWLDNASYQPELRYTKTWHYKNIDADETYEEAQANPAGDAVTAIKSRLEILADPDASRADKQLALKILIHVMGDLHQPMHLGHAKDLGGNRIKLKYFDRDTNLHAIWDSSLPDAVHKWSYTEWQQQIDRATPEQIAEIQSGTIDDWAKETARIASEAYVYFQPGCKVMYNDIARWTIPIERQFLRGGLRLAHLLNTLYTPSVAVVEGQDAVAQ